MSSKKSVSSVNFINYRKSESSMNFLYVCVEYSKKFIVRSIFELS